MFSIDEPITILDTKNIKINTNVLIKYLISCFKYDSSYLMIIINYEQLVQLLGDSFIDYIWRAVIDKKECPRKIKLGMNSIL